jgi:hypothetical protein
MREDSGYLNWGGGIRVLSQNNKTIVSGNYDV